MSINIVASIIKSKICTKKRKVKYNHTNINYNIFFRAYEKELKTIYLSVHKLFSHVFKNGFKQSYVVR